MSDKYYLVLSHNMKHVLGALKIMLCEGLHELGIECEIIEDGAYRSDHQSIILGANFIEEREFKKFHKDSIIFNVENYGSIFMDESYLRKLRSFAVWDYSFDNAKKLAEAILRPVYYIPLFFVQGLVRLGVQSQQDIDVLFFGSFNARRQAVLDQLKRNGVGVTAIFNVYGEELDSYINRAKIVLNMHFYDNGHLEMIRIFDLLSNKKAVVTELNREESIDTDLRDAVLCAPYDELVNTIQTALGKTQYLDDVAERGRSIFERRKADPILRLALDSSDRPRCPADLNVGSGKSFNDNQLNLDINECWHPDVVADIADKELINRSIQSARHGCVKMKSTAFNNIFAWDVLSQISELTQAMTNIIELLSIGGRLHIKVPYDLSYGAWQDPKHVRAFNEHSWLYYCEWHWYIGWRDYRFDVVEMQFSYSHVGNILLSQGLTKAEILRTPRAVDEMRVILCKRKLSLDEQRFGESMMSGSR